MEVLAALALMVIIAPVTVRGISLALRMNGDAKRRTETIGLAEARLNETLADGSWQDGDTEEQFDKPLDLYRWRQTIEDYSPDSRMRLVTISVVMGENNEVVSSVSGLVDAEME